VLIAKRNKWFNASVARIMISLTVENYHILVMTSAISFLTVDFTNANLSAIMDNVTVVSKLLNYRKHVLVANIR